MNRPNTSSLQAIMRSGRLATLLLFAHAGICSAQAGTTPDIAPAGHPTLNQVLDSVSIHSSTPASCLNAPTSTQEPPCHGKKTGVEDATTLAYLTRPSPIKLRQRPDQPGYLMPMTTGYGIFALFGNSSDLK